MMPAKDFTGNNTKHKTKKRKYRITKLFYVSGFDNAIAIQKRLQNEFHSLTLNILNN